ncbi:MAG: hypothetical protein ABIJ50_07090 [Pseudomonadota bacterium]
MGDTKKVKAKCCQKFVKKGNHCSSCPLTAQDDGKKTKKVEQDKKKKSQKKQKK